MTMTGTRRSGGLMFAAMLFFVLGALNIINGIAILANAEWIVFTADGAWLFDFTVWGWITLVLGVIEVLVGWGLLNQSQMARVTGMVLAVIAAINAVFILPIYLWWGILAFVVSIIVLRALSEDYESA